MLAPKSNLAEFMIGFMQGIGCAIGTAMLTGLVWTTAPASGLWLDLAVGVGLAATIGFVVSLFRIGMHVRAAGVITGGAIPFLVLGACAAAVTAAFG